MEGFLMLDGNEEMARWWRAFAIAKREGHPEFIRGLVTYMISNYLGDSDRQKQRILVQQIRLGKMRFDNLTCEILSGTRLRWRHVFLLVGKEFNPTRERELVKQIYVRLKSEEESVKNF
jgi:hypothetical protein